MDILCSYCGKLIHRERYRYPSQVALYKDKFCSTKCHDLFRNRHVEVTCCVCGAKKSVKASVAAKWTNSICSTECRRVWQSRKNLAKYNSGAARIAYCETCGKEITRKPSQIAKYKHNYCSRECKAAAQKGPRPDMVTGAWHNCEVCGKQVWRTPATLQDRTFCSRHCANTVCRPPMDGEDNPMWQGGRSCLPYSPGFFPEVKRRVKRRDGFKCAVCGRSDLQLHVHHIDGEKTNHDPANLITLCASCHPKVHRGSILL